MMAIGFMNMIGSCTSCYVTTGSFSRSAINYNAGAKIVVSNIVMLATVLVTLLFLMPLFHCTPNFILAAIIITLRIPSFLILAVEYPIYFANSTYLQERIMRWIREEEEQIKATHEAQLKCVILDMDLKMKLLKKGILTRIYVPVVIIQGHRELGVLCSAIESAPTTLSRDKFLSSIHSNSSVAVASVSHPSRKIGKSKESEATAKKILEAASSHQLAIPPLSPSGMDDMSLRHLVTAITSLPL